MPDMTPDFSFYSAAEAARLCGVRVETVYRLLATGRFPARAAKVGAVWRISRSGLDAHLGVATLSPRPETDGRDDEGEQEPQLHCVIGANGAGS